MNPLNPPITFTPPFTSEGDGAAASAQPTASSVIAQIDEGTSATTEAQPGTTVNPIPVVKEFVLGGGVAAMEANLAQLSETRHKLAQYYKADMTMQFALALAPHVVAERLHNSTHENQAKLLWSMAEAMAAGAPAWVVEGFNAVG